jgi:hypothetical protein
MADTSELNGNPYFELARLTSFNEPGLQFCGRGGDIGFGNSGHSLGPIFTAVSLERQGLRTAGLRVCQMLGLKDLLEFVGCQQASLKHE